MCILDDTDGLKRFLNEAIIMRNFDHENVMRMIGFAVKSNNPYILLPYMENKDLRTYLKQNKQVHIYTYVTLHMCILYVYTYVTHL